MAVANSSESLPWGSRERMKTGMASWSRAHLRSSLFDELRATGFIHSKEVVQDNEAASEWPNDWAS